MYSMMVYTMYVPVPKFILYLQEEETEMEEEKSPDQTDHSVVNGVVREGHLVGAVETGTQHHQDQD